jgi:hypothetical protein
MCPGCGTEATVNDTEHAEWAIAVEPASGDRRRADLRSTG